MKLKEAVQFILSEEYLTQVSLTGKWCHHGSKTIHYFEDEDLIIEYANTRTRKSVLKEYIHNKINDIINDLEYEAPEVLYRAIYLDRDPKKSDFYGYFWSSKCITAPCVKEKNNCNEYLLQLDFDENLIDWKETLMSRMDFVYGDREKEFYLKNIDVLLKSWDKI